MKVDFSTTVKDHKGNEIKANGNPVIIGDLVGKVLFELGLSKHATSEDKYMAYKICNRINQSVVVELSAEESALVVRVCSETLAAGVYGQVRDLVEGN